jgi:hypothetical protein
MNKVKVPIIDNPELLDSIISNIQKGLAENIGWLDYVFGRAERLVKFDTNNRKIYTPNVYVGGNEYMEISPSSDIGNFCFFWVDDPQNVSWEAKINVGIKTNFSLIFWFNFNRIYNSADQRNKEELKKQILDVLNGGFWLKKGRITVNRIYELSENIFRGFSLDETENQFLMQPYGGFRFEGMLEVSESCGMVIPSGIVFNPIFEEEGINSYNFTINGKEAVKGNSYPLGSNVVFDIYPVEGKGVENISVNGKVYEGDVIENGKRFVFTLLESPQNIVVNLVNALVEVEASGRAFPIWNTKPGDDKLMSLSIHGLTEQIGTPTPANPVPMRSVGDMGLLLSVMPDKECSDYQLLNIKAAMKKAGHDGILRLVNGIYDEVVYDGKKWKLIQRIQNDRIITCTGVSNHQEVGFTDCYFYPTKAPINGSTSNGLLSTHFVQGNNGVGTININDRSPYLGIFRYPNTGADLTKEEITAWLGENEVYVSYQLAAQAEYPLDLPQISTYEGQTYFATNAAEVKPRMIAQCKVSKALDYIREGLIGYYTGRGRSNTDENKNILPDLSGNGNDLENKNFAYTPESGYGDGYIQYDGVDDFSLSKETYSNIDAHIHCVCSNYSTLISNQTIWGSGRSSGIIGRLYCNIRSKIEIDPDSSVSWLNGDSYANRSSTPTDKLSIWSVNVHTDVFELNLGTLQNNKVFFGKVRIYDVLMYDRHLTEEEIEQNYKASLQFNGKLL